MVNFGEKHGKNAANPDGHLPKELPKPSSRRGSAYKLGALALIVAAGTAGVLFWFSQDEKARVALSHDAQAEVSSVLQDTVFEKPFQLAAGYLLPQTPLPASVTQPHTTPGTLAGQEIRTAMGPVPENNEENNAYRAQGTSSRDVNTQTSLENGENGRGQEQGLPAMQNGDSPHIITPLMPKVQEDNMVPLPFVEDVAQWMVEHYAPDKGVSFNVSAINLRYGQQMYALMPAEGDARGDVYSARTALLRYAFNPSMLTALYDLYAERFVQNLGMAAAVPAKGKALTPAQASDMYATYAQVMAALGGVFDGIGNLPDFGERMTHVETLSQESLNVHSQLTDAVFDLDTAREEGNETAQRAAQLRIDGLNATYQRILADRQTAREDLVNAIYGADELAKTVDQDTVLFVAEWLDRRESASGESSLAVARILRDMAGRLQKASEH